MAGAMVAESSFPIDFSPFLRSECHIGPKTALTNTTNVRDAVLAILKPFKDDSEFVVIAFIALAPIAVAPLRNLSGRVHHLARRGKVRLLLDQLDDVVCLLGHRCAYSACSERRRRCSA